MLLKQFENCVHLKHQQCNHQHSKIVISFKDDLISIIIDFGDSNIRHWSMTNSISSTSNNNIFTLNVQHDFCAPEGLEPTTNGLRGHCSTIELLRHFSKA